MIKFKKTFKYMQRGRQEARGRMKSERLFSELSRISAALEGTQSEEKKDDREKGWRDYITIALLFFTTIFTGASDVIFYYTLQDSHENAASQLSKTDTQLGIMKDSSQQTDTQIAVNRDLALAARDQAVAVKESAGIARDSNVAGSRAWVGPNGATIDVAPVADNPMNFQILYQNSGRQPATGFISTESAFTLNLQDVSDGLAKRTSDNIADCRSKNPVQGAQVVYPSTGFSGNQLTITLDKSLVDADVVSGNKLIGLTGCFVYENIRDAAS